MSYTPEKYQLGIITDYLKKNKFKFSTEVSMYSIPIDIAYIDGNDIITIELKSKDVKKGLAQAQRNLLYVDYSYLAVWSSNLSETSIDKFQSSDVGLISVDDTGTNGGLNWVSTANKNIPNDHARDKLRDVINDEF